MSKCTAEEFIEAWQTSDNVPEVAEKIREPKKNLYARACYFRKMGIPLKRMKKGIRRSRTEWNKLAELARSLTS